MCSVLQSYVQSIRLPFATLVLTKRFNFAIAAARIPVKHIISNLESLIRRIQDRNIRESIRQNISHILKTTKPRNISYDEFKALRAVKNKDVIILLADKDDTTVVINTKDYKQRWIC